MYFRIMFMIIFNIIFLWGSIYLVLRVLVKFVFFIVIFYNICLFFYEKFLGIKSFRFRVIWNFFVLFEVFCFLGVE